MKFSIKRCAQQSTLTKISGSLFLVLFYIRGIHRKDAMTGSIFANTEGRFRLSKYFAFFPSHLNLSKIHVYGVYC